MPPYPIQIFSCGHLVCPFIEYFINKTISMLRCRCALFIYSSDLGTDLCPWSSFFNHFQAYLLQVLTTVFMNPSGCFFRTCPLHWHGTLTWNNKCGDALGKTIANSSALHWYFMWGKSFLHQSMVEAQSIWEAVHDRAFPFSTLFPSKVLHLVANMTPHHKLTSFSLPACPHGLRMAPCGILDRK